MRLSIIGVLLSVGLVKAATWQVLVGGNSNYTDDVAYQPPWAFNKFYPNQLTINEGDWVQFRFNSMMGHQVVYTNNETVSLMNSDGTYANVYSAYPNNSIDPNSANITSINTSISSGLRRYYDADYWVQFNISGNFMYYCLIHLPYMVGNIQVLGNSSSLGIIGELTGLTGSTATNDTITLTDHQVYMSAQQEISQDIVTTNNILTSNNLNVIQKNATQNADGSMNYNVWAGWGVNLTNGYSSSPRFYPAAMIINVGDSVTWDVSKDFMEEHIVSFNGTGYDNYFPDDDMDLPNGTITTNPLYIMRSDNASITANYTFFNSGFLSNAPSMIPGVMSNSTWTATFNTTGVYRYICALHVEDGMIGEILVVDPSASNGAAAGQVGPDTYHLTSVTRQTGVMNAEKQEKPRSKNFKRLRSVFGKPDF